MAPLLGPQSRLLPLLNGVRHLDMLTARFRIRRCSAASFTGRQPSPDGVIEHLSSFMTVITGPVATPSDPIADEFVARLKAAGVEPTPPTRSVSMWNSSCFSRHSPASPA